MSVPSIQELEETLEEVRQYFQQEYVAWRFSDLKQKDISYKLYCAIVELRKLKDAGNTRNP